MHRKGIPRSFGDHGMSFGRRAARVVIGGLFTGHGTQKPKGWCGGLELEGTGAMMGFLGMHPHGVTRVPLGS